MSSRATGVIARLVSITTLLGKRGIQKRTEDLQHASFRSLVGSVAGRVHDPRNQPCSTQARSGHGEAQACDEEGHEERGEILCEVGVGTLGYICAPKRKENQD